MHFLSEPLNIIFIENPISRAYLQLFIDYNISINNFIYLNSNLPFGNNINSHILFKKNNYYPLKYLKHHKVLKLIHQIEDFFSIRKNFCRDMYIYKNLNNFKIKYIKNLSINSKFLLSELSNNKYKDLYFLNTGNEILKDVFKSSVNFYHIHPGYLPLVRGADGSLNSILRHQHLGVSSFIMSKKIDEGPILFREKFDVPKLKLDHFDDFPLKELYRIWYSFFDPLLRTLHLKKIIKNEIVIDKKNYDEKCNYYSFLKENDLKFVFDIIFR